MAGSNKSRAFTLRRRTSVRKAQNLKLAFSEFYLSLILLQNYQSLNFMGFKKILKKHDKVIFLAFLRFSDLVDPLFLSRD